jgi:hypothetical protein
MAAQKSTTISSINTSNIGQTWYTTLGNTRSHGNTVGMPLGPITAIGTGTGGTYLGNTGTYGTATIAPLTVNASGKIDLQGESADITINGTSLLATLAALQERLNWMQPATELEAEWDQLRELGDRYRELEQQCREKSQMWAKLRTLPKLNQV